ncbi:hypothetical protein NQZ68_021112 [Dissostichus eleginoides]|nr:hypothetical protein NQZ68_021112 [Dissostichus eleginoides]
MVILDTERSRKTEGEFAGTFEELIDSQESKRSPQALMKCAVRMSASIALRLTWDPPHSEPLRK